MGTGEMACLASLITKVPFLETKSEKPRYGGTHL